MNIAKAETCVSLTFCQALWTQLQNNEKATLTQLKKLDWDSRVSLSSSYGHKEVINLIWKRSLEFQVLDILQWFLYLRPSKCMVDWKDHSVNKTCKTSWLKSWKIRQSSQNFLHFQPLKQFKRLKVMFLNNKDATNTNVQDLQTLRKNKAVSIKIYDLDHLNNTTFLFVFICLRQYK